MRRAIWTLIAVGVALSALPVIGRDALWWRGDGLGITGSSVGQQTSNAAFNLFDSIIDATSVGDPTQPTANQRTGFFLYWLYSLPGNFGGNVETGPKPDWPTWPPVTRQVSVPGDPTYSPDLPKAWGPMVFDLDTSGGLPNHFLVHLAFDPDQTVRDQVLEAYFPETTSNLGGTTAAGELVPEWRLPVLTLAPVAADTDAMGDPNQTGVVPVAPLAATVDDTSTVPPTARRVIYLVVGTGENNETARIVCLSLRDAPQGAAPVPAPAATAFDPGNPQNGGVMWSYDVVQGPNSANPGDDTAVAGIGFIDDGSNNPGSRPRPLLFITTQDGQVICLNARARDVDDVMVDGDVRAGEVVWQWQADPLTPGGNDVPEFNYGAGPALARVPLFGAFEEAASAGNALLKKVTEHVCYVVNNNADIYAFEAAAGPVDYGAGVAPRWTHHIDQPGTPMGVNDPEEFLNAPVVFQGGTPLIDSGGTLISGTTDVGHDDIVVLNARRGRVYALDALGDFQVDPGHAVGSVDGQPTGTTDQRWRYPDTPFLPAPGAMIERLPWPRNFDDSEMSGAGEVLMLSPMASALGADANPDLPNPDLDPHNDLLFVPFLQDTGPAVILPPPAQGRPPRKIYEWIGSVHPWGFMQTDFGIDIAQPVTVTVVADGSILPSQFMRFGRPKITNAPALTVVANADGTLPPDTVYLTRQKWVDTTGATHEFNLGDMLTVDYTDVAGVMHMETNPFPWGRGRDAVTGVPDAAGQTASLGELSNRLQARRRDLANPNQFEEEEAIDIQGSAVNEFRPPAMMAAGGGGGGGTLAVGSAFRGRLYVLSHTLGIQRILTLDPSQDAGQFLQLANLTADIPALVDAAGAPTLVDGWLYNTWQNGHIRAYSNVGGGAPGTGRPPSGNLDRYIPPSVAGNTIPKPRIRLIDGPDAMTASFLTPGDLVFDWGDEIFLHIDYGFGPMAQFNVPPQDNELDPRILNSPTSFTLRDNGGTPIASANATPPVKRDPADPMSPYEVVLRLRLPSGVRTSDAPNSRARPVTPGTPLLSEVASLINPVNGRITPPPGASVPWHFDLYANQPGLTWQEDVMGLPTFGQTGPWQFFPGSMTVPANDWDPTFNTAPWITFANPLGVYYNPDLNSVTGMDGPAFGGFDNLSGMGINAFGTAANYAIADSRFRKNGDVYLPNPALNAWRSVQWGSPLLPTVGVAITVGVGAGDQQILYADHGGSTPAAATLGPILFPSAGKLRIVDRSNVALRGQRLSVRFQAKGVTKLGSGAALGGARLSPEQLAIGAGGVPQGSFQQNAQFLDDAGNAFYASLPPQSVVVTKVGTNQDATASSVPIAPPVFGMMGKVVDPLLADEFVVRVDVPRFTPDDLYATRFRALPSPMNPAPNGNPMGALNPFFTNFTTPDGVLLNSNPLIDPDPHDPMGTNTLPNEDVAENDPRFQRVVVYIDSNNNGRLDTRRGQAEAFRTFVVQVMVRPELKLRARERTVDLGAVWHGKGDLNTTNWGAYQRLQAMEADPSLAVRQLAAAYRQSWKPFTLQNLGNVNLGYVKPELLFTVNGQPPQDYGFLGEGNDPYRALTLLRQLPAGANRTLPRHLYLRTSLDFGPIAGEASLVRDRSGGAQPYGVGVLGGWLQKAPIGASQPSSATYDADPSLPLNGVLRRAKDLWMSLDIPTGTPLGTYGGQVRWFNDRSVLFTEDAGALFGFTYATPAAPTQAFDGLLNREGSDPATLGQPLEPVTDPSLVLKVRVVENFVHGRRFSNMQPPLAGHRTMPAVLADASAGPGGGIIRRFLVGWATNRIGLVNNSNTMTQSFRSQYDLFGAAMTYDLANSFFPYDRDPAVLPPWLDLQNVSTPPTLINNLFGPPMMGQDFRVPRHSKLALTQDGAGVGVAAWTRQITTNLPSGSVGKDYRLFYRQITPALSGTRIELLPGGGNPDRSVERRSLRMLPIPGMPTDWVAFWAQGSGSQRRIAISRNNNLASGTNWSTEHLLATSRSLTNVTDPYPAMDPSDPTTAWLLYQGFSPSLSRNGLYLSKMSAAALRSIGTQSAQDPLGREADFGRIGFGRIESDVLRANATRTVFTSSGVDWIIERRPPAAPTDRSVMIRIARADVAPGTPGSLANPLQLIRTNAVGQPNAKGELVFRLSDQLDLPMNQSLRALIPDGRVIVDRAAGSVRLNMDARRLMRRAGFGGGAGAPDPVLLADFKPGGLRVTTSDFNVSGGVLVPASSFDLSWYRQQTFGGGVQPIAGRADRLWAIWRRASGPNSGGPAIYYRVLRPAVKPLFPIGPIAAIQVTLPGGGQVFPEEVDPQLNLIYFPAALEGQRLQVTHNGVVEDLVVGWRFETPELAFPMATSVNEGGLDAFASFELVPMIQMDSSSGTLTPATLRHFEKLWVFWASSRGSGTDLYWATHSPRLGPEAVIAGTIFNPLPMPSNPKAVAGVGPRGSRARRRPLTPIPWTKPPISSRVSYK